jgi:hypothetical protein
MFPRRATRYMYYSPKKLLRLFCPPSKKKVKYKFSSLHPQNLSPVFPMAGVAMPSPASLEPAQANHPCAKMRLSGRQNNMPEEFCLASTCALALNPEP